MFGNFGTTEIIVIAIILLLFFGGSKLSELARGLGESGKELKKVKKEFQEAMKDTSEDAPQEQNQGKEVQS